MRSTEALFSLGLAGALTLAGLTGCGEDAVPDEDEATVELRILETTDIHVHIADYDYYQDAQSNTVGLARTASLIHEARAEVRNSVLVDNGDLIQGNPLGDYIARARGLEAGDVHPVHKAMNMLGYDVGNVGNHEFNYGLEFLEQSLAGAAFPYISANVFVDDGDGDPSNDQPYMSPYVIVDTEVVDTEGNPHTLKIGYIGFVPPQIMIWDRANLEGQVIAKDIVDTANDYVPMMKSEGADLIIAVPHSGLTANTAVGLDEDASFHLAAVPDIDAIAFGHAHRVFPGPDYEGLGEIDVTKGTIRGVAAVMAGFWGSHLGVIDLTVQQVDGEWQVVDSQSEARPITERVDGQTVPTVDADSAIIEAIREEHEGTVEWISQPIGETSAAINSFFARVQDDPSVQIVTEAQRLYVEQQILGTELEGMPVLSAGAPFKAGRGGPNDYTDVPAGVVSMRNVADLYIYPNTLKVVQLTGAQVREWLERSAGAFHQIDPGSSAPQSLLDDNFPSYNFDVIDGVTYDIDLTEPSKYDPDGQLIEPIANRIKNLEYEGSPIDDEQLFLVATNNYRAGGGGNFPEVTPDKIVIDAPDENRQVLANFIADQQTINPSADTNWRILPINETVDVTFVTSPSESARAFAAAYPQLIDTGEVDDNGFAIYRYDLAPAL